jgi:N-succinyldiaminopimelate aminotransferase
MRFLSSRAASFQSSVFGEMSVLAQQLGATNLGQGFPDFEGPAEIKEVALEALKKGSNQYGPSWGHSELRASIAHHAKRFYGVQLDPQTEVVVTAGATEALFATALALLNPGDEAVLFEPFYDSYEASVILAGATPRYVSLYPPDATHDSWWFREAEVAAAFSSKTRVLFLNTPHNPTGKVFTRDELIFLGRLCQRHGAILLSDEVYEHLIYDDKKMVCPQSIDSIKNNTISVSSGGKSFSFTGWKIGWAKGPSDLISLIHKTHQWVTFCQPQAFQLAIARALHLPDQFFVDLRSDYQSRRDVLADTLTQAGFPPIGCEGAYFLLANSDRHRGPNETDVDFCKRLARERGVVAIPPSVFYSQSHRVQANSLVRFAFCKSEPVLAEAHRRLNSEGLSR